MPAEFAASSELTFPLLTDKPRLAKRSLLLGQQTLAFDEGLLRELRTMCTMRNASLADAVLAGFAALLFRYTGEMLFEIAIGSAGADFPAVRHPERGARFQILELTDFEQLLQSAAQANTTPDRSGHATPALRFWSESIQPAVAPPSVGALMDLGLCFDEAGGDATLRLWYALDLFFPTTAQRMLCNLREILAGAVASPNTPVHRLPILSEAEQKQILKDWNQTTSDVWRGQCLHQLVEEQTERSPEAVAVEHEGMRLSYPELNAKANQLAHYLMALGATPHSHVGICLPSCADFAVATLAVLKAGCACVPLDPKYPADRLAYMLEDAGSKFVLTSGGHLPSGLPRPVIAIDLAKARDEIRRQPKENPNQQISSADSAYVIYTSGSTGKPRGVLLRHAGLANYNLASARYYAFAPGDRVLQFCSLSFDAALEEIFATLASGATLVFRSKDMPLDVPGFLHWVRREKITVLDLPTAYWHEWVGQFDELRESIPPGLRLVIVGGEKALGSALATWRQGRHDVRWVNTYGPTEASIAVTRYELAPDAELPASNIPIGGPIENCRIYVLDRDRNPVPVGVAGELYIGGLGVAQGYLNRPEMTAQKFIADPFSRDPEARLYRTGDMARFLENGVLEYLGRQDDQVKVRGFRIELGEIEEVLSRFPGVSESAVIAVNDPAQGKTLVAYCSPASSVRVEVRDLRAFVASQLPEYMVPAAITVLDTLPKTPNGKIDRRLLARREAAGPVVSRTVDLPATALQTQLKRIWEDTLGRKPIGTRENFFELGGHSLLAARLMQKVSRLVDKTVPLALLFEAPTIEKLAGLLERNEWAQRWSCLVPIHPEGTRPPIFCVHGVGGNVLGFRELARLMTPDYPFYGFQAQGLDGSRPPFENIEEMAAHYIREMRAVQPEGPFLLSGYSFGGLVAYEMARQLYAGGEEVALLALLDTYPGELEAVTTSIWKLLLEPKRLRALTNVPKTAKKSVQRRVKGLFLSKTLKEVLQANHCASARYALQPYEGKTTLFRAEQSSLRAFDDPHAAWASLAVGGLRVEEISGDHGDILMAPQVGELAMKLKAVIDHAVAERNAPEAREEEALA